MADIANLSAAEVKAQLKNVKVELKSWEHDFYQDKGRKPQKDDILQDRQIAKKYKLYSRLKARAAEYSANGNDMGASEEDLTKSISRNARSETEKRGEPLDLGRSYYDKKFDGLATESKIEDAANEVMDLDRPTEASPVLKEPGIAFRTNHPLLKDLSFIPDHPVEIPAELLQKEEPKKTTQVRSKRLTITNEVLRVIDNPIKQNKPMVDPDLFKRISQGEVLRCKIIRKAEGLDSMFPTYFLLNESDEKFLLGARKRKKAKNPHYIVSSDVDNLTKTSRGYVAKIKAEASGLAFTILDARHYSPANPNKGLRDLCAVTYDRNTMPRDIKCAIRPTSIPDDSMEPFTRNILEDLIIDSSKVALLKSAKPKLDKDTGSYGLNFGGRVKVPSVKNFQLVDPVHQNSLVLQFGRTGEDTFALDAFHPLTPVEAFTIALTVFDAYEA